MNDFIIGLNNSNFLEVSGFTFGLMLYFGFFLSMILIPVLGLFIISELLRRWLND